MLKYIYILLQFILLIILAIWAIQNSKPVSFELNDIIITTSTSILLIFLLIFITLVIILQRLIFYIKQSSNRYRFYKDRSTYDKGNSSFVRGMVAIANRDFKRAIIESKNTKKFLKNESLSLLLISETLKVEKKFNELEEVYEKMLKEPKTHLLGLRGLMEQNLRSQDYHHAFIYGEKLFNLNPNIDKLYETLLNIVGKTNNWHKLIQINEKSLKYKIIDKKSYSENKSIALYEIAKIKYQSDLSEAIYLMEQALKLKQNFSPYVNFYIQLLINQNKLVKAKKILKKTWSNLPHAYLKGIMKDLSNALKISYFELAKFITDNSKENEESKILLAEALIEEKKWIEARNYLKEFLQYKPLREVCLLMAKIEEGESGDPQKIDSWITRSNFGQASKIWICQITNLSQEHWSSISQEGYFNSLEWKYPSSFSKLSGSGVEMNSIGYIS